MIALSAMTIWIMLQGWRIVTGRSRDSLMALVSDSLRATLIVGIATGMTFGGPRIFEFLSNDVNAAITAVVTGRATTAYDEDLKSAVSGKSVSVGFDTGGSRQ